MPFPVIIRRSVVIDSPLPAKQDRCAQMLSVALMETNLPGASVEVADDAVAVECQQWVSLACHSGSSSFPNMMREAGIPSSECNFDDASSWSDFGEDIAELFPTAEGDDGPSSAAMAMAPNQDIFDQWDALYEREKHNVYAITDPHSISENERVKFFDWSYAVVDKYEISRHTVSIAAAHLDRLVSNGWVERSEWSLASVTCLYLAVKVNSTVERVFEPELMAHESVYFSASQIIDMEYHICQVFDWFMNPPVPSQFVDIITPLLMSEPMLTSLDDDDVQGLVSTHDPIRRNLLRHSHYLCELSVMDSFFSDKEPSSVACASVMVTMDAMHFPPGAVKWFASLTLSRDQDETEVCAWRLRRYWFGGGGGGGGVIPSCEKNEATPSSSQPRAVTPTKGETPPDLKRMRRDAIMEALAVDSV